MDFGIKEFIEFRDRKYLEIVPFILIEIIDIIDL